jgi:outer membrane protein OmpA-like peptidoglycan-associated protein
VLKNQGNGEMVKIIEKGGYKINVIYDKTGREVGRSCAYKDAPKVAPVVEAAPVVAAVAAAATIAAVVPETPKEKEDDYLICKEYEGHAITDKGNNVALFTHSNGQYYFVVYNDNGTVKWRSEGFTSTKDRDDELAEVLKNQSNGGMVKTIEKGGFKINVVVDKSGREVGRSCAYKDAPVAAPILEAAPVAAAAAAAVAAAVAPEIPKQAAPKVEVPKAAPIVAPEPSSDGWFKWWYLLLLLPLLWFLWKGCNKTTLPPVETPAMSVDTPKVETPATAPVATPCSIEWIYFDFDKSDIRSDATSTLDKVADLMSKNPDWTVDLSGHTDIKGNAAYNKALSARRYKSATAYLSGKGIDGKRMATTNARNTDYIGNNDEPDVQRQYNRRVEITLKDKEGKVVCAAVKPAVSK